METQRRAHFILLAEDEPSVRELLSRFLIAEGYQVATAPNGAAALAIAEQNPPDLIILNIYLPVLDGPRFVQAYRHRPGPHAPILVITGIGYGAQRAAALGVAGYLEKPFRLIELRAKITELIGPPPATS